jgi:predicted amino acid racemase
MILLMDSPCLSQIVGVTESADITTQLEKRVISRLNAQFIEVSTPTAREVCKVPAIDL